MKVGIALLPPENIAQKIMAIEESISQKYGVFGGLSQPPHVTIKRPFEADLKDVEEYCKALASRTSPVGIHYNGYGSFPGVVFLDVQKTRVLQALHNRILYDLEMKDINPDPFEGVKVAFHTTLAFKDVSEDQVAAILADLRSQPQQHLNHISTTLGLAVYNGTSWEITKEYSLRK